MATEMLGQQTRGTSLAQGRTGALWLVVLLIAPLPLFWYGFERLSVEWARPEYRFKAFVPLVSLVMFLQVMRTVPLPRAAAGGRWIGVAAVVLALLAAVYGNVEEVDDVVFLAMFAYAAGTVVTVFGLRGGLAFWAPVASLALMIPLPRFLYFLFRGVFEALSAELGLWLAWLGGISVFRDGQVIDFGAAAFRVNELTSSLVNLLPVLTLFFFVATLHRGPLWLRLLPLLLTAPALVVAAALRIVAVGAAAERGGAAGAAGMMATTPDWIVALAAIAIVLAICVYSAWRVEGGRASLRRFDVDLPALFTQIGRLGRIERTAPLVAAAGLACAIALGHAVAPPRAVAIDRASFALFPPEIGAWSGTRTVIAPGVEHVLGADDYVLIDYVDPAEAAPVTFWSAYYHEQKPSSGVIHSPELCLPLDGWNIVSFNRPEVAFAPGDAPMPVNRALITKEGARVLVYYWFEGRGRRIAHETRAKFVTRWDSLALGRSDGALVRFSTPVLSGEGEAAAEARLRRFVAATLDRLPRFIPE